MAAGKPTPARWAVSLEEPETEEGSDGPAGLITPRCERYLRAEQSLEAGAALLWTGEPGGSRRAERGQRQGGKRRRRVAVLRGGRNP